MDMISPAAAIGAVENLAALFDEGTGTAEVIIWSGSAPSAIDEAVTVDNLMLARISLQHPSFGQAQLIDDAVEALAFNTAAVIGLDSGEASFYRAYDRNGDVVMQGPVGLTGSDESVTINQTNILAGANVSMTRFVIGMYIR